MNAPALGVSWSSFFLLSTVAGLGLAGPAMAQTPEPLQTPAPVIDVQGQQASAPSPGGDVWNSRLQLRAWYAAPEATLQLPGSSSEVSLEDLNADSPTLTPVVQFTLSRSDESWIFEAGGFAFDRNRATQLGSPLEVGTLSAATGVEIDTDVQVATAYGAVGTRLWFSDLGNKNDDVFLKVIGLAGGRAQWQSIEIASPTQSVKAEDTFFEIFGEGRLVISLSKQIQAELNVGVGLSPLDKELLTLDIGPTFTWRPTENIGVQIGYRLRISNSIVGSGSNEASFEGSLAGIYGGVEIRF
jgi:hypothetical protein